MYQETTDALLPVRPPLPSRGVVSTSARQTLILHPLRFPPYLSLTASLLASYIGHGAKFKTLATCFASLNAQDRTITRDADYFGGFHGMGGHLNLQGSYDCTEYFVFRVSFSVDNVVQRTIKRPLPCLLIRSRCCTVVIMCYCIALHSDGGCNATKRRKKSLHVNMGISSEPDTDQGRCPNPIIRPVISHILDSGNPSPRRHSDMGERSHMHTFELSPGYSNFLRLLTSSPICSDIHWHLPMANIPRLFDTLRFSADSNMAYIQRTTYTTI
ncbi:hypothetical protein ACRALDRAFT_210476 [Sodiomyces alcalophilus JCM 7366]|uniref:uncharacterized protein n=1 Tax=Sodiomyces alcalophilus JCM 7366 TaxID=591952 RepID=UPI0039B4154A